MKKLKGEGEVAFSAPGAGIAEIEQNLIKSTTPCHAAQVVGLYRDSNALV